MMPILSFLSWLWIHFSSESSMFVTKDRFILKTCGTTTLLSAVDYLLDLVKKKVGFDKVVVSGLFYFSIKMFFVSM